VPDEAEPGGEGSPDIAKRDYDEAFARRTRIYELRGRIMSDVNELEAYLNNCLSAYFKLDRSLDSSFKSWLLSSIQFSAKLEAVKNAAIELGITERTVGTLAKLQRAAAIRNDQAHSHIAFNPSVSEVSAETRAEFLKWHSIRRSRRGLLEQQIEERELQATAAFISGIEIEVLRLWIAFLMGKTAGDATKALDDFDALNPDVAQTARTPPEKAT
jgi:hypothetical protein